MPSRSVSNRLTNYPTDRLGSPLDVRSASLEFRPGGPARISRHTRRTRPASRPSTDAGSVFRGFDDLTQSFTSSVTSDLTVGVALVALAIGVALGAVHTFAPGHGKTVMAAYLVGERGTVHDGLLIGLTVAATHTVGVLALSGTLHRLAGAHARSRVPVPDAGERRVLSCCWGRRCSGALSAADRLFAHSHGTGVSWARIARPTDAT